MNLDLLLEAERRGILPPDKAPLLAEARRRGLVSGEAPDAPSAPNTNPGVSAEAPPDMFFNPQTGQYTSRELLTNHMLQTAPPGAMTATLQGAGRGATLGGIDEVSGYLNAAIPGKGTAAERSVYGREVVRAAEDAAAEANPDDMLTGEIAGAISLPVGAVGKGLWNIGTGIAAGTGLGAVYGALTGEEGERVEGLRDGAFWGAASGVLAPLIGMGAQKVANRATANRAVRKAVKGAQTAAEQRGFAREQYKAFDDAGAEIALPAFRRLTGQADEAMRAVEPSTNIPGPLGKPSKSYRNIVKSLTGMDEAATSGAQALGAAPETTGVKMSAIEDVRQAIGPLTREVDARFRPTRGAVSAGRAVDAIDQFVDTLQPEDLVAGNKEAAISALKKARELWRSSIRTQSVENAIDAADSYLSGTESGLRNQFRALLARDKKQNLFTDAERAFLKKVIGGNMASRLIRTVGDGLGRKAALFTGGALGGLEGAAIGAMTGEAASLVGESAARRKAEIARALVASGALRDLPKANPQIQRITETLMRRAGATLPQ